MKKASKSITLILTILLTAGTFTGCVELMVIGAVTAAAGATGVGIAVGEIVESSDSYANSKARKAAAAQGRMPTLDEFNYEAKTPFENEPEDRLVRRTSALTGGTPVDVTPYIVHSDSFAVINDTVEYCKNVFIFKKKHAGNNGHEFDMTLTYEVNNQQYQENLSALVNPTYNAKSTVQDYIKQYFADKHGVKTSAVKKFKVQYDSTKKFFSQQFTNVFVEAAEPCYYMFDVDVEYQNDFYIFKKLTETDYTIYSKVYRSDFKILAGAVLDVQYQIWRDVVEYSDFDTPLPRVNFVKVVKYTE